MKTIKFLIPTLIASSFVWTASAQNATATVQTPAVAASASVPTAPADIASGAAQVLKLQQGGLGKDVMLNYVNSANLSFHLRVDDIVYLHKAGVPEEVITAMMDQEHNRPVLVENVSSAPAPVQTATTQQPQTTMVNPPVAQTTVVTQPPVVYSSPSYVYGSPYYSPYYYGGGPYYYGAPVSLSFGYGWGGWHGGWGGGWHGGGGGGHHH